MILAHIHFQFKNISCEGICLFGYILGGGGGIKTLDISFGKTKNCHLT